MQTAFLGDLLLSVPLLLRARALWPEDRLVLMCREHLGDFFKRTGLVDEVIEIRKKDAGTYRQAQEALSGRPLARVISPHSSFRTAWFARGLNAAEKISFRQPWNFFAYNRRLPRPRALPDALRQLSLLAPFDEVLAENLRQYAVSGRAYRKDEDGRLSGVPIWASPSLRSRLLADRGAWTRLMEKLDWQRFGARPKVLIFPGSVWATKRWTEEGFVEVGRRLTDEGNQVFIMGAGNEVPLAERVAERIPGAVSLAGRTSLYESALVLAHGDLMIGNDSASIHLASCTETPLITIFGPTVLEFGFRPWSNQAWVAEREGLSCRPCGPHGHNKCPRGTHECMKNLSADEVLKSRP
ncbi:MAG: glycosyltransferase family 9 protein [Bdellovibrionaceae bacterium]|nr:glycosyltransferase family 9 protein [Pseudobdellovibrionaceae bacterium]